MEDAEERADRNKRRKTDAETDPGRQEGGLDDESVRLTFNTILFEVQVCRKQAECGRHLMQCILKNNVARGAVEALVRDADGGGEALDSVSATMLKDIFAHNEAFAEAILQSGKKEEKEEVAAGDAGDVFENIEIAVGLVKEQVKCGGKLLACIRGNHVARAAVEALLASEMDREKVTALMGRPIGAKEALLDALRWQMNRDSFREAIARFESEWKRA